MVIRRLVLVGATALLACAAAWGQAKPAYDEALGAVTEAGCERFETDRYVRFFCEEGETLWYFTREGRPEHAAYFVATMHSPYNAIGPRDRVSFSAPITGGDRLAASSREEADKLIKARSAWMKDIFAVWRADAASMQPKAERDRGKLYLLEPS